MVVNSELPAVVPEEWPGEVGDASSRLVVRFLMFMLTEWKLAAGMRMKAWDAGSVTVRSCCTAAGDTRWQLSSCNIIKNEAVFDRVATQSKNFSDKSFS